jgi:hypothetical protein
LWRGAAGVHLGELASHAHLKPETAVNDGA